MTERRPPEGKGYDLQRDYTQDVEPYWFRWADQWWTLPHLKMLDFEVQLEVFKLQGAVNDITDPDQLKDQFNDLFDLLMGAEQGTEFRKVERPLQALMVMLTNWRAHSEADEAEGESSASDGSSKSTGRPSSRTSNASTKSASPKPSTRRARKSVTPRVNS